MTFGLVKHNNNSISAITTAGTLSANMVLIKEQTASSSSSISFVHGSSDVVLDSTYPIYVFKFINIHPATDNTEFQFNGSDDDSSHSYDVTKTTTFFRAYHQEDDNSASLSYDGGRDLAQGTGLIEIISDFNTTSAIDAVQFKMTSGNIDSGTIKLYGVT